MGHKPKIKVEKREDIPCYGCQRVGKVTQIATIGTMLEPHGTICLCNLCLGWLKNKLRGF